MRQINFVIIFIFCLALVLFSLENTEPASINIVKDLQVQAPLSVELLLAMGLGAVLAWLFSVWTRLQRLINSRQEIQKIRQRDNRIQELEQNVQRYQAEISEQRSLPPAAESAVESLETSEA
ncbi:MAG: LapA family protein [Leptolyngbyaceae bacterium]|nr:LapA family protein [Leptolyngbyaceae bacterium]